VTLTWRWEPEVTRPCLVGGGPCTFLRVYRRPVLRLWRKQHGSVCLRCNFYVWETQ